MKRAIITFALAAIVNVIFAQEQILKKKVSVAFNNIELQDAVKELEKISEISFAFNNNLTGMKDTIQAIFEEVTIEEILNSLLKNKPLSFKTIGDQITIFQKREIPPDQHQIKNSSIVGVIIDENSNEPLPFINVVIEESGRGTITDLNGQFEIKNLSAGTYILLISSIGYTQKRLDKVVLQEG
jgi:hypothetical protein